MRIPPGVATRVLQGDSKRLEKEISDIQIFIITNTEFTNLEYKSSFQVEIEERKHNKYIRDKRDFEVGEIYRKASQPTINNK